MTEEEILSMAKDQLEIACENLLNQKNKEGEAYKMATWEVESCVNALKAVETQTTRQPHPSHHSHHSRQNTMSMA